MTVTSNRILTVILLVAMLGVIALAGNGRQAPQSSQDVFVTNATSAAVPVKNGSAPFDVTVANTIGQPLPVKENGNWYVGLTGVPNVHVANTSSSPVLSSITNTASSPVPTQNRDEQGRNYLNQQFAGALTSPSNSTDVNVPAPQSGKRMVVTHISCFSNCSPGDMPANSVILDDTSGAGFADHYVGLTQLANDADTAEGNSDCFFILNAGDTVSLVAALPRTASNANSASFTVQLEGYYLNVP